MEIQEQSDSAFLDIAANMLAIILIVTLFALVTQRYNAYSSTETTAEQDPAIPFATPKRVLFPPFSRFYFVLEDRIAQWDQTAIIQALGGNPNELSGNTEQGRFRWVPDPLTPRDIDAFQLYFYPDQQALLKVTPSFSQAFADRLLLELTQDYAQSQTAPVFIVYPSGMETFATFYEQLQKAGLRFRWFARDEDTPLYIGRHPSQFTDYAIYW